MKKFITPLIVLSLVAGQSYAQRFYKNLNHKPLSILVQRWDEVSNDWFSLADSVTIQYNTFGLPTLKTTVLVSGIEEKEEYNYDANQRLTSKISWRKTGSQWDTSFYHKITYNTNNHATAEEIAHYVLGARVYTLKMRHNNTYDANNKLTDRVIEEWFEHLNDYRNTTKLIFAYNASNQINSVTIQTWDTTSNTFNNSARQNDIVWKRWNGNIDGDIGLEEYNFNSLTESYVSQYWNGTTFQTNERYTAQFDSKLNYTNKKYERLNGTNWETEWESSYILTYRSDSSLNTRITREWDPNTSQLVNRTRETFGNYYSGGTPSGLNKVANNISINVYPNPAQNQVTINCNENNLTNIEIYDLKGELVYRFTPGTNVSTCQIDVNAFKAGIYHAIITLSDGSMVNQKLSIVGSN